MQSWWIYRKSDTDQKDTDTHFLPFIMCCLRTLLAGRPSPSWWQNHALDPFKVWAKTVLFKNNVSLPQRFVIEMKMGILVTLGMFGRLELMSWRLKHSLRQSLAVSRIWHPPTLVSQVVESHANAIRLDLEANLEVNYPSLQIKVELGLCCSIYSLLEISLKDHFILMSSKVTFCSSWGMKIAIGN